MMAMIKNRIEKNGPAETPYSVLEPKAKPSMRLPNSQMVSITVLLPGLERFPSFETPWDAVCVSVIVSSLQKLSARENAKARFMQLAKSIGIPHSARNNKQVNCTCAAKIEVSAYLFSFI
jgi:hypothetical protein